MKKLVFIYLLISNFFLPALAQQDKIWDELKTTFPKVLSLQSTGEEVVKALGKAKLIEGDWHFYSIKAINYPLAIKIVNGKMIGGNYQFLSPYPKVITLASWKEKYKDWKVSDPADGHDFGRYQIYTSPDGFFQLQFVLKNGDGVLNSFKWGDWK